MPTIGLNGQIVPKFSKKLRVFSMRIELTNFHSLDRRVIKYATRTTENAEENLN